MSSMNICFLHGFCPKFNMIILSNLFFSLISISSQVSDIIIVHTYSMCYIILIAMQYRSTNSMNYCNLINNIFN